METPTYISTYVAREIFGLSHKVRGIPMTSLESKKECWQMILHDRKRRCLLGDVCMPKCLTCYWKRYLGGHRTCIKVYHVKLAFASLEKHFLGYHASISSWPLVACLGEFLRHLVLEHSQSWNSLHYSWYACLPYSKIMIPWISVVNHVPQWPNMELLW